MELKFSHRKHFSIPKSLLSKHKASFPLHTLSLKSWAASEPHRFQGLLQKWRLHNKSSKDHCCCSHVVKEGETLSSISKMYGVSVHSIAAVNKDIVDIDLVFKGHLLNIPSPSLHEALLDQARKSRLWHSICEFKTSHCLSNAKATGYFLVLVTLLAFCIGYIISTFHVRVARNVKSQAVNKSTRHHPGAKNMRWKSALTDTEEGDTFDSESGLDSSSPSEGEAYISYEEASHAYSRLKHDYQKFLSECGISECGYWPGGSAET